MADHNQTDTIVAQALGKYFRGISPNGSEDAAKKGLCSQRKMPGTVFPENTSNGIQTYSQEDTFFSI